MNGGSSSVGTDCGWGGKLSKGGHRSPCPDPMYALRLSDLAAREGFFERWQLVGSLKIIGDLETASAEIAKIFAKSLERTTRQLGGRVGSLAPSCGWSTGSSQGHARWWWPMCCWCARRRGRPFVPPAPSEKTGREAGGTAAGGCAKLRCGRRQSRRRCSTSLSTAASATCRTSTAPSAPSSASARASTACSRAGGTSGIGERPPGPQHSRDAADRAGG